MWAAPAAAADLDWDPGKTWVFVVGILEWEREGSMVAVPDAMIDRRDEQLADFFRESGVPDERLVYLQDAEATKVADRGSFIELLDQTDEGECSSSISAATAIATRSGETWFACYDAGDENESGWSVRRIFTTIENHFSGDRALA